MSPARLLRVTMWINGLGRLQIYFLGQPLVTVSGSLKHEKLLYPTQVYSHETRSKVLDTERSRLWHHRSLAQEKQKGSHFVPFSKGGVQGCGVKREVSLVVIR